jgi:hypothetical protein
MYSDSIEFQSPNGLTLTGLFVILVSLLLTQWDSTFHCFLWNFTNSPVMIIFSFYFMQYILWNWKSVAMYIDKKDDLKDIYSISNFIAFELTL